MDVNPIYTAQSLKRTTKRVARPSKATHVPFLTPAVENKDDIAWLVDFLCDPGWNDVTSVTLATAATVQVRDEAERIVGVLLDQQETDSSLAASQLAELRRAMSMPLVAIRFGEEEWPALAN